MAEFGSMGEMPPPDRRTLFMRGFPGHISLEDIRNFFLDTIGKTSAAFQKRTEDGTKFFLALRFEDERSAEEALRKYSGREILGYRIFMQFFRDHRIARGPGKTAEEPHRDPRERDRDRDRDHRDNRTRDRDRDRDRDRRNTRNGTRDHQTFSSSGRNGSRPSDSSSRRRTHESSSRGRHEEGNHHGSSKIRHHSFVGSPPRHHERSADHDADFVETQFPELPEFDDGHSVSEHSFGSRSGSSSPHSSHASSVSIHGDDLDGMPSLKRHRSSSVQSVGKSEKTSGEKNKTSSVNGSMDGAALKTDGAMNASLDSDANHVKSNNKPKKPKSSSTSHYGETLAANLGSLSVPEFEGIVVKKMEMIKKFQEQCETIASVANMFIREDQSASEVIKACMCASLRRISDATIKDMDDYIRSLPNK